MMVTSVDIELNIILILRLSYRVSFTLRSYSNVHYMQHNNET